MTGTPTSPTGRNIVIFSDGTGQRGGVYFDEARTNIYKLYRATRSGPDSNVPSKRQLAFYDPGLGTQPQGAVMWSIPASAGLARPVAQESGFPQRPGTIPRFP